jgi:energy-coupling factor transport system ATP-binding protein
MGWREKTEIACASVSACKPQILLLDEPSSNLESRSTWDLRKLISIWKNRGNTVIIAEHRLYFLNDLIDRIIFMKDGEIHKELNKDEVISMDTESFLHLGLRPLSLEDLSKNQEDFSPKPDNLDTPLNLTNFKYTYGKEIAIDIESLQVPQNEIIAIIGENGAGKSTFAGAFADLKENVKVCSEKGREDSGGQRTFKNILHGYADVNHQIFTESVLDEILLSMEDDEAIGKAENFKKI